MAYDLDEQEQMAALKAWWNRYGGMITLVTLVAATAALAYNGWNWYQRSQAAAAAAVYEQLESSAASGDAVRVKEAAGRLFEKYSSTAYAQMGALTAAKASADAGEIKNAKAQLQWAIEHGKDDAIRAVARQRLAGLLLDEGAYDEALKVLETETAPEFAAANADRRGDVLVAANRLEEARRAYQDALDRLGEPGYDRIIQLKLDALGGGPIEPPASAATVQPTAPEKK